MTPQELYRAGNLQEAIDAQLAVAKKKPTDVKERSFLCELLALKGDIDRVDKQLDVIGTQDPEIMAGVSLFRQLLRGEEARQQLYNEGRVPEVLADPDEVLKLHLEATIAVREERLADAKKLLDEADEKRPKLKGKCNGEPFEDFRDLDDMTSGVLEVLTSTGKFFWIPFEKVTHLEFTAPHTPRDLQWRVADITVTDGPEGQVFIPAIYPSTYKEGVPEQALLGRMTDWQGAEGEPIRGTGQRMFLCGEAEKTIMELETLEFGEE